MRRKISGLSAFAIFLCYWVFPSSSANGQVVAWGTNIYGALDVPASATNVVALAGGLYHGIALRGDATVVAWGVNNAGQTNVPVGLTNVVSVAGGDFGSMALGKDGNITIWGMIGSPGLPVAAQATNLVAIAPGPDPHFSLVLRGDGTVVTWGTTNDGVSNIPPNVRDIVSVAAGNGFSLALRADGHIVGWGSPLENELAIPAAATNIVAIAAGSSGGIGLAVDGTITVWGLIANAGNPLLSRHGYTNVIDIACPLGDGNQDSCLALRADGTLVEYPDNRQAPGSNFTAIGASSVAGFAAIGAGPPAFTGLPINRTVPAGATAYFRSMAAGAMPISYQWICNGTNVSKATNSFLGVTNVQPSQAGSYYSVIASNAFGVVTNAPMMLSVVPLEIYSQPGTLTLLLGGTNTFTNAVAGKGPFSYQWELNGTNIPGATNPTLSMTNLQFANAGAYSVVISNVFGAVTSSVQVLDLVPSIIGKPLQDQTIFLGANVTLNPNIQILIPVTYQWQFNGTNLDGATNASLNLTNFGFTQVGNYSVIFNDAYETVTNGANLYLTRLAVWGSQFDTGPAPPNSTNLLAVATGAFQSLAINSDHTVLAWGTSLTNDYLPPAGLPNVIAVSAGNSDSIALKADGTLVAWGDNGYGETNVPAGLSNVVAISAGGSEHIMALKSDGTVVVWGNNQYGQTNVPAGLGNVVAVSAGEWNCLALKADGTVVAWGAGTNNTQSDPNWGESIVPPALANVTQIAAGGDLCGLALQASGTITGWGNNGYGEITMPSGLSNVTAIAAGYGHSVALELDGTVAAWGYNYYGETNVPAGLAT